MSEVYDWKYSRGMKRFILHAGVKFRATIFSCHRARRSFFASSKTLLEDSNVRNHGVISWRCQRGLANAIQCLCSGSKRRDLDNNYYVFMYIPVELV